MKEKNYKLLNTRKQKVSFFTQKMLYEKYYKRKSVLDVNFKFYLHEILFQYDDNKENDMEVEDFRIYLKIKESDYIMELLCGENPLDQENVLYEKINDQYGFGTKIYLEFTD